MESLGVLGNAALLRGLEFRPIILFQLVFKLFFKKIFLDCFECVISKIFVSEFFLKNNLCYTFKQAQKQEPYTEGYNGDTVFFKRY